MRTIDEREKALNEVQDRCAEKSWEIDTHSDDGFQQIVYCSEIDKIIEHKTVAVILEIIPVDKYP